MGQIRHVDQGCTICSPWTANGPQGINLHFPPQGTTPHVGLAALARVLLFSFPPLTSAPTQGSEVPRESMA